MAARQLDHLGNLGFRPFEGLNPADTHTMTMDMQHDLNGLLPRLGEEPLQNVDDELHRRVVVIEEQHFVERGFLGLGPGFGDDARADAAAVAIITAVSPAASRRTGCFRTAWTLELWSAAATHSLDRIGPDKENTQATT